MTAIKATLLLLPLLFTGCTARFVAGPAPSEAPRPLNREEVVSIAMNYATSRGYECRVKEIEREGREWQVQLAVAAPMRGEIEMMIDGWSGEVVRAHEEMRGRGHHRRWEHEGDDEHEHDHRDGEHRRADRDQD